MQFSAQMIPETMSCVAPVVAAYRVDPYNHGKITPAWFFGTFEAQTDAISHAAEISVLTLVMYGTDYRTAPYIARWI